MSRDIGVRRVQGSIMPKIESKLLVTIVSEAASRTEAFIIRGAVIAGWTGRDKSAVDRHIRELEAVGVARPATTPIFYRVAATRLTTASTIEVVGADSSGEVEFVLIRQGGILFVGVGSDHTDRKAETYNVTVSKQMCEKPIASEFWPFGEVADHWDHLILRSWAQIDGTELLYQEGSVSTMLAPNDLLAKFSGLPDGWTMFCGTLAALGGIRPAARFSFEIEDPVRRRSIRHSYIVDSLPILG